jgi:hypothetical protein
LRAMGLSALRAKCVISRRSIVVKLPRLSPS